MSNDLNEAADELARWAEGLERKARQYQNLQGRMAAVSVTETSVDNRISITVDASGVTTDIHLSASTRGMDPAALSAELMACISRAHARLRNKVTDLVHTMVGDDEAGQTIIGQYAVRLPDEPEAPTFAPSPPRPGSDPELPRVHDAALPGHLPPPAAPGRPQPDTRKPNHNDIVVPDEPSEEDLYYRRKSWLE